MDVKKSTQTWIRFAEIIEDRIATDADLASFQLELENLVADHKEIVDGLVMMVRSMPIHLQAYLNEFTFRFNRRFWPFNAFRSILGIAAAVEPPTYDALYSGEYLHPMEIVA